MVKERIGANHFSKMSRTKPRKLVHIIGDAHIYKDHLDAVNLQLERTPLIFPTLEISNIDYINNINEDMFQIYNYNSEPSIKAKMIP